MVRGPGQKRDIREWYINGMGSVGRSQIIDELARGRRKSPLSCERELMWTIKGLSGGRCLAA